MKKQIWLEEHHIELIVLSLEHFIPKLNGRTMYDEHKVATNYTVNRINELIKKLEK